MEAKLYYGKSGSNLVEFYSTAASWQSRPLGFLSSEGMYLLYSLSFKITDFEWFSKAYLRAKKMKFHSFCLESVVFEGLRSLQKNQMNKKITSQIKLWSFSICIVKFYEKAVEFDKMSLIFGVYLVCDINLPNNQSCFPQFFPPMFLSVRPLKSLFSFSTAQTEKICGENLGKQNWQFYVVNRVVTKRCKNYDGDFVTFCGLLRISEF